MRTFRWIESWEKLRRKNRDYQSRNVETRNEEESTRGEIEWKNSDERLTREE